MKLKRDERPLTNVLRDAMPGFPCSDTELLRRAVQNAGRGLPWAPRWRHVEDLFELTPGSAVLLCRACEVDPEESVGESEERVDLGVEW